MGRRSLVLYLLLTLGLGIGGAPVLYFASWAGHVASCRHLDRPGAYLAYCENTGFGSYEHDAYRFGLEPEAIRALQQAKILFLGNSRLQYAFSTPQVDAFFAARATPYHLLGFGYGESSRFPRELIARYQPKPKVVIINADPFFQSIFSPVAYEIAKAPLHALADGVMKYTFDRIDPWRCRIPRLCTDTDPATYRDRRTGQWIWHGVLVPRDRVAGPITPTKASAWSDAALPAWIHDGDTFLPTLDTPRDCILLTGVPTPAIDAEAMAAALGARLALAVVQPVVPDLSAVDTSHLSADSAERWSAAFLAQAAPQIDACLAR